MSSFSYSVNPQRPLGDASESVSLAGDEPVLASGSGRPVTAGDYSRRSANGAYSAAVGRSLTPPTQARQYAADGSSDSKPVSSSTGTAHLKTAGKSATVSIAAAEVFARASGTKREFVKYSRTGRRGNALQPFTSDVSVGKFGVLGDQEALDLESKLMGAFSHDELALDNKSEVMREDFLRALYLFLAINSGSIGNMAGRMGVRDDSQPLQFGDVQIAAAEVSAVMGDRAYAYMRARATEIRDTVESAFLTSRLPDAERSFPGVCRTVELIKTVAAMKGISQCPQYVAVGSQYAADTPPYIVALLQESASKVLNATQGNVRESGGPAGAASHYKE